LETWPIINPHDHITETKRLVFSPIFYQGKASVVALLHARGKDDPVIKGAGCTIRRDGASIRYERDGKTVVYELDFDNRTVKLAQK